MKTNIDKLNNIARDLTSNERERMKERRKNRHWLCASSAIAAKIKRQLRILGLTQSDLAVMLGVTPANITRYLNGQTNFELKTLVEIERKLGIKIIDKTVVPEEDSKSSIILKVTYNYSLPIFKESDSKPECINDSFIGINKIGKDMENLLVYG
ncbi:MAG: helix-turn-helix domain-containing protein [Muribaculaceae bacterium]|nr:helix-turn-helix domain-containing protein [Muribaculaceae bacterium]